MTKRELINGISSYLFWDVDRETVDADSNAAYIIQRVLEYGQFSDWMLIYRYYGLDLIVAMATRFRTLEPRAVSLLCCLADIPENRFRCCTTKQSLPRHWNF